MPHESAKGNQTRTSWPCIHCFLMWLVFPQRSVVMCRRPWFAGWLFDCCYLKWLQMVFGNSHRLPWDILLSNVPLARRNCTKTLSSSEHWTHNFPVWFLRFSESAKHGSQIIQIPQTERVSIISLVILVPFAPLRMTIWADMFWTAILGISEICGFQTCALYILESQMHMDPCPEGAKCDHPRDGKERGWQLRHYAILQHVSVVIQCYSVSFVEQPRNLDLQRIWLDQHEYPQKEIVRVRLCSRSPQIFAW